MTSNPPGKRRAKLGVILLQALARGGAARVDLLNSHAVGAERRHDQVHRRQQALGIGRAGERGLRAGVGQSLVGRKLRLACLRQAGEAAARIVGGRRGLDEALVLQAAQQPAHQPGIELELVADLGDLAAAPPDGVEHARRAQRPAAAEKRGVKRPHLHGDGAREAAETGDRVERHDV